MTDFGMMDHLRISVKDLQRSKLFWVPVLQYLGYSLLDENGERVCFGLSNGPGSRPRILFSEAIPQEHQIEYELGQLGYHHFAFRANSRQQVDGLYELLGLIGATVQGPPSTYDYSPGYYAVYFRDPDNLKFELVFVPNEGTPFIDVS